MTMIMSNKTMMMKMMIVKFVLLFLLSIDLVSCSSASVSQAPVVSRAPSVLPAVTPPATRKPTLKPTFYFERRPTPGVPTFPIPVVPTGNTGFPICFSGMNTVEVKNHGVIRITELKIGDYVKIGQGTTDDNNNNNIYTQVYGFGHFNHDIQESFIQFHFDNKESSANNNKQQEDMINNNILEVSSRHLVFVIRMNRTYPIRSSDVKVGDILSGKIVLSIGSITRRGLYAPLTMSGDIVVSGIRSSNYVDVLDYNDGWYDQHVVGHAVFGPQRIFCSYFLNICQQETYKNHNGYGPWAYYIITAASKLNHLGWFANMIFSVYSIVLVHCISCLELLQQPISVIMMIVTFLFAVYIIIMMKIVNRY